MNLPNKLTLLRVIMIPFFVFFMLTEMMPGVAIWAALALFSIASITDMLDGQIARRYNLVTNFGKFMDPLADKLLVCSALICFISKSYAPAWFVIVIISREFIISGFRLVASDNGVVIAASWWGKFKTTAQMTMIIYTMAMAGFGHELVWRGLMLYEESGATVIAIIGTVIAWISFALTLVSLIDYIVKNRSVIQDTK